MKSAYEILKSDKELNYILDNANFNLNHIQNFERETSGVNYTICCHGRHHALFVVGVMDYILSALSYDEHKIELGKVASLLHDIGVFFGRSDHAKISAFMCLNFISKTNLSLNDSKVIKQAILDHSTGTDIQSAIGAVLLIADKMTDKERGIHVKADMIKGGFDEAKLNKSENPHVSNRSVTYAVKDFQFNIKGRDLIFNYIVEGDTEVFISEYSIEKNKPIILTKNAVAYLKCNYIRQVNGDDVDF